MKRAEFQMPQFKIRKIVASKLYDALGRKSRYKNMLRAYPICSIDKDCYSVALFKCARKFGFVLLQMLL